METRDRLQDSWQYAMGKLRAMWILLVILLICGIVLACLHLIGFLIGVGVGIVLVLIIMFILRLRWHRHHHDEDNH
ncbi:MAG: hypothetical protein LUD17_15760 [Bacteroidales bacterium]|nr:hypothetical protein [Bacteroidales bacterium]